MTMTEGEMKTVTLYILEHAIDTVYDAHMKGPCKNKEFMEATDRAIEALKDARLAILEVKK